MGRENLCENRLICSVIADNAALGTIGGNLRLFDPRSAKTGRLYSKTDYRKVKTK